MAIPEERRVRLLSHVDVLEPLSEEELRELAQRCSYISVCSGEDFFRSELHDGGMFLILEGRVRVYLITSAGKEFTLEVLGGSTMLWARMLELVDDQSVYAQAVEQSVLAFMGREVLDRFVLKKPEMGLRMMDLLAKRLSSSNERMAEIAHKEVLSRLAGQILRLLENEGTVDQQGSDGLPAVYTHEKLGTMIGAERPSVTRAFGRLQDEGILELRRRRIHVKDLEALRHISEQ